MIDQNPELSAPVPEADAETEPSRRVEGKNQTAVPTTDGRESPGRGPLTGNIIIDEPADVVTIYGVRFAGEVLRTFTRLTGTGEWFRVVNIHNGVATIETRRDELRPSGNSK